MPTISYPTDLSLDRQVFWLYAHMLFPDSPHNTLSYFVRNLVRSELGNLEAGEEVTLPIDWLRALAFGAGFNELDALGTKRTKAGATAGLILVLITVMAAGNYDRPSLNKACHIVEEIAARKKKQGVQIDHYVDRKDILSAWKLMKNSAHFWAALEWVYGPYGSDVLTRVPRGEESVKEFIRLSSSFRQFGCQFHESNSKAKKTLLDSDSCLRLPDEFENEAYSLSDQPVAQWIVDILQAYRAPIAL